LRGFAGIPVVDEDVGLCCRVEDVAPVCRVPQVDLDGSLATVERQESRGATPGHRWRCAQQVSAGRFYPDHLGAELAEQMAGQRCLHPPPSFDDHDAGQRTASRAPLVRHGAMSA
jgi:hypothetical protein